MEEGRELNRQDLNSKCQQVVQNSAALRAPSYADSDVHNLQVQVEELCHRYQRHGNDMSPWIYQVLLVFHKDFHLEKHERQIAVLSYRDPPNYLCLIRFPIGPPIPGPNSSCYVH